MHFWYWWYWTRKKGIISLFLEKEGAITGHHPLAHKEVGIPGEEIFSIPDVIGKWSTTLMSSPTFPDLGHKTEPVNN
ncbi:hypothetical protein L6452_31037 [Arctium lappa]|uniref:Uncharacterized protein n=1 Tax=Arctium lappa TaxID=4217 RepID=A0ACB8ZK59_ARCLA|nr:hypothetical protein L6452_31037 [Arctium lappa]